MKVAVTQVKTFKCPDQFHEKMRFVDELVSEKGLPKHKADEFKEKDRVMWESIEPECSTIFVAEILD